MLATIAFILVLHDWPQPRHREITTAAAITVIEGYRSAVSPRLRGRVNCRFEPTCSLYGLKTIRRNGALVGGLRTAGRIARCGPWTPAGTVDQP